MMRLVIPALLALAAPTFAQTTCDPLTKFKIAVTNLQIAKAETVSGAAAGTVRAGRGPETIPAAMPAYCRSDGAINPRTGVDNKPYGIGFALAMPTNWNGGFVFQGGGATLDKCDALTAIVDWVENNTATDAITATGKAFPGRSRPLCPWPKFAHYKGAGDSEDARNFECRE